VGSECGGGDVTGDFNGWDRTRHPMRLRDGASGNSSCPRSLKVRTTKYSVLSRAGFEQLKADPYGFFSEVPPKTASVVWGLSNYAWACGMDGGARKPPWLREAVSIYEVHLIVDAWAAKPVAHVS